MTGRCLRRLTASLALAAALALGGCASDAVGRPDMQSPVDREAMMGDSAMASRGAANSQRSYIQSQLDGASAMGAAGDGSSWWTPIMDTLDFAANFAYLFW